ncbi:MAG TPA: YfcE family phosphodiesterase [Gammaproteobacteria bacterium]|nr:YfcE family phosphodiesterase [Gammaproteobacteria bacterium]
MPAKIGLISDTHSTTKPLEEAMSVFRRERVDDIICAGDVAGYGEDELMQTIDLLIENDCKVIAGNHDNLSSDFDYGDNEERIKDYINSLPGTLELTIEGKRILVVHAHPPDSQHGGIKLLDPDGHVFPERRERWRKELENIDCDILIVGHTHQVFAEKLGDVLVINPGSTLYNHTCMILTLPDMDVQIYSLSNMEPVTTWNWGVFFKEQQIKEGKC